MNNLIYHYTNNEALSNILVSPDESSLRATGIRFLNDQSELHYGTKLIVEVLKNNKERLDLGPGILEEIIETFEDYSSKEMSFNYYVACFSKATMLVDQWRGYGDNGIGFALGYDPNEIKNSFKEFRNASLVACNYNPKRQESALKKKIDQIAYQINITLSDKDGYGDPHEIAVMMFFFFMQPELLKLKHHAYKQEKEWRIIVNYGASDAYLYKELSENIEFRSNNRGLVPYTTLQLPSPKKLIVGPSEYQAENRSAAELMLKKKGFTVGKDIGLTVEDIPYRG